MFNIGFKTIQLVPNLLEVEMFSETIKLVCKIYLFQAEADGRYSEKIKKNIYFMSSSLNFTPKNLFAYPN